MNKAVKTITLGPESFDLGSGPILLGAGEKQLTVKCEGKSNVIYLRYDSDTTIKECTEAQYLTPFDIPTVEEWLNASNDLQINREANEVEIGTAVEVVYQVLSPQSLKAIKTTTEKKLRKSVPP